MKNNKFIKFLSTVLVAILVVSIAPINDAVATEMKNSANGVIKNIGEAIDNTISRVMVLSKISAKQLGILILLCLKLRPRQRRRKMITVDTNGLLIHQLYPYGEEVLCPTTIKKLPLGLSIMM